MTELNPRRRRTANGLSALPAAIVMLGLVGALFLAAPAAAQEGTADSETPTVAGGDDDEAAALAARRERLRRLRYGNIAEMELAGSEVRISYPDLPADGEDYRAFDQLAAGEVASWNSARAVKLLTGASLAFDGVTVEAGNVSPDYPGVYSLWPKRTDDGWALVFNGDADIWGSQRDPESDAVAAPLEHSLADEPTEKLTIEVLGVAPGAGLLRIAWGEHQFLAAFQAAP